MPGTKWTPGPWIMGRLHENRLNPGIDVGAENNSNIALVHHEEFDRNASETIANARLIAKAPEMVELLKKASHAFRLIKSDDPIPELRVLVEIRKVLKEIDDDSG